MAMEVAAVEPATPERLRELESAMLGRLRGWFEAFVECPNANNWTGLSDCLREYQTAWMNGRVRPEGGQKDGV